MKFTISASELRSNLAENAKKPAEERWNYLVTRYGRYAAKHKRKGIVASELRDEKPKRATEFGSELMRARRHGAKGSSKTLPGRGPGRDYATAWRDMMIKQGVIRPVVIKRVQPAMQVVVDSKAAELIKRMLTPTS